MNDSSWKRREEMVSLLFGGERTWLSESMWRLHLLLVESDPVVHLIGEASVKHD